MYIEDIDNTELYKKFMLLNPAKGNLKVRCYSASEAIPISGVKVVVSKEIDGMQIIFYEGYTDMSGVIGKISLPVPKLNTDNMEIPAKGVYNLEVSYQDTDLKKYIINVYEGICVLQNILITPDVGENYG